MRRRTVPIALGALCIVGLVLAVLGAWLNVRPEGILVVAAVVAILAGTGSLWLVARRRLLRIVAGCLGALLLVALAGFVWVESIFNYQVIEETSRTPAPDGSVELVARLGHGFMEIDPSHDVVLRRDRGLLSQESVVWQGREEGDRPQVLRFVGPGEVEIISERGCRHRAGFNRATLTPDRVYRESAMDRCA